MMKTAILNVSLFVKMVRLIYFYTYMLSLIPMDKWCIEESMSKMLKAIQYI